MDWITTNWKDVTDIVAYVIAIASIIVKFTPSLSDDNILQQVRKLLAAIGLNKTP